MNGDRALEEAIDELLDRRAPGATICPSEAARRVDPDEWRDLVPDARRVAGRLVAEGRVEMTQRGEVVDPATARGPVRLRRPGPTPGHHPPAVRMTVTVGRRA